MRRDSNISDAMIHFAATAYWYFSNGTHRWPRGLRLS